MAKKKKKKNKIECRSGVGIMYDSQLLTTT